MKKFVPGISLAFSAAAIVLGIFSLSRNTLDGYCIATMLLLGGLDGAVFLQSRWLYRDSKRSILLVSVLALVSAGVLAALPQHITGSGIDGIVNRSLISAILLLAVGVPSCCFALYFLLGAKPDAWDKARYPVLVFPVLLAAAGYGLFLSHLINGGSLHFGWKVLSVPYQSLDWREEVWVNGWPTMVARSLHQDGLRNQILGTMLLMVLTAAISLPLGIAVGIFKVEYEGGWAARVVGFSTQALRAVSIVVLALTAKAVVDRSSGTFLSDAIAGYYVDANGAKHVAHGSFILAAAVVSLLVIPIIARVTEEGIRSLPSGMREGSLGVGASPGHTLWRIALPWSLPNIVTGLMLGCAEAAGSFGVIIFLAGDGQFGVGPLKQVTSLEYVIFQGKYGPPPASNHMLPYQYTAAILLIALTLCLSIGAMVLRRKFSKRYQGT